MLDARVAGALTALTAGVLVYLNTLPAGFTFDDNFAVVRNKDVIDNGAPLHALLVHDFWGQPLASDQSHKSYRPLTVLCFRLTRQAWQALPPAWTTAVSAWRVRAAGGAVAPEEALPPGLDPLPFHAVNVMLHALASALVCWLAYHLLQVRLKLAAAAAIETHKLHTSIAQGTSKAHTGKAKQPQQSATRTGSLGLDRDELEEERAMLASRHPPSLHRLLHLHLPACASGLAFALHPVHTEAVAGIVGQAELLCACLGLPALLLYFAAAQCDDDLGTRTSPATRGSRMHVAWIACRHWVLVAGALLLTLGAALCKEIGITVVGCMVLYDVLLVPLKCGKSSTATGGTGATGATGSSIRSSDASWGEPRNGSAAAEGAHVGAANGKHAPGSKRESVPAAALAPTKPAAEATGKPKAGTPGHGRGQGMTAGVMARLRLILLQRKWLRVGAAFLLVLVYVRVRSALAGDQLVRIYRKVENPIPFLPDRSSRVLSTAYLHARYALLLVWPQHLSADWSYACVRMVEHVSDWRNIGAVVLYGYLVMTALASRAWMLPVQWWRATAADYSADHEVVLARRRVAAWRLVVLMGLTIGPFFPASNVLFYVGTFIGERLLYLPSVGAVLLASEAVFACALSAMIIQRQHPGICIQPGSSATSQGPLRDPPQPWQASRPAWGTRLRKALCTTLAVILGVAVVMALAGGAWRTWQRNWDWMSEETLFTAAQQVCGNSAKVALNSGILARRHRAHATALQHFYNARRLEPGFCEPGYWIGSTLINQGHVNEGVVELEQALSCKWVAAEALAALNKIYQLMQESAPTAGYPIARWGALLVQPHVGHVAEGCELLEAAATTYLAAGDALGVAQALATCEQALERIVTEGNEQGSCEPGGSCVTDGSLATRTAQLTDSGAGHLLECIRGRRGVQRALAIHGPTGPEARTALYAYLQAVQEGRSDCRLNAEEWMRKYGVHPRPQGGSAGRPSAEATGGDGNDLPASFTPSSHMQLIHRFQAQDADDPWLQKEWGTILALAPGRAPDAIVHLSVASLLFLQWVQAEVTAQPLPPLMAARRALDGGQMGAYIAAEAAADVLWDATRLMLQHPHTAAAAQGAPGMGQGSVCEVFQRCVEARAWAVAKAPDGSSQAVQLARLQEALMTLQLYARSAQGPGVSGAGAGAMQPMPLSGALAHINCTTAQQEQVQRLLLRIQQ